MTKTGGTARENHDHQSPETPDAALGALMSFGQRLMNIEQVVREMHDILERQAIQKQWYGTTELAAAMGVSQYTVQERWCNAGRIDCEKDPATGKWRIPGHEFQRLVRGGAVKAKKTS
jgi:hypothetical protein